MQNIKNQNLRSLLSIEVNKNVKLHHQAAGQKNNLKLCIVFKTQ